MDFWDQIEMDFWDQTENPFVVHRFRINLILQCSLGPRSPGIYFLEGDTPSERDRMTVCIAIQASYLYLCWYFDTEEGDTLTLLE